MNQHPYISIAFVCVLALMHTQILAQVKCHRVDDFVFTFEEQRILQEAKDSVKTHTMLTTQVNNWKAQGYLTAQIDTIYQVSDTTIFAIYKGPLVFLDHIEVKDKDKPYVTAANLDRLKFGKTPLDSVVIVSYLSRLMSSLNDNGYPLATVRFDTIIEDNGALIPRLHIDTDQQYLFDTIHLDSAFVSTHYLSKYLNIAVGDLYNQRKVSAINTKINNLGFVSMAKPLGLSFEDGKADLYLSLNAKKSSIFDLVFGVLPSNQSGQRKINFNIDLKADYLNKLKRGERFFVQLRRISQTDQKLETKVTIPYLLQLPVGLDFGLDILRNQNQSVDANIQVGSQYIINGFDQIKLFGNFQQSSLINIDTTSIASSGRLPKILDYKYRGMGVEAFFQHLDYRFNPSRGWMTRLYFNTGQREVLRNNQILAIDSRDYSSAYDTVATKGLQLNLEAQGTYFIPVFTNGTIKLSIDGGIRLAQNTLAKNEIFRIGGSKLLRGFDELSIFTDRYIVSSIEYRLLINQNSYLTLPFIDISRMRALIEDSNVIDTAWGAGMGLNFGTGNGIFNISFAAGSRLGNPVDFNNTKVHFGYISLF